MKPLMRRAGVTSKPKFAAGLQSGAICTVAIEPSFCLPVMNFTSSPPRSSMGMALPSSRLQSMVEKGNATKKGTPLSRAASALR
jgi:hypothetical protein